jgi:general secretion pathway protein A
MTVAAESSSRSGSALRAYEKHFQLSNAPFRLAPDPRFFFESGSHTAAVDQLTNADPRYESLVVVTGEVGSGKTTLCRAVVGRRSDRTFVAALTRPPATGEDLLRQILRQFGLLDVDRPGASQIGREQLLLTLERFLRSLVSVDAQAIVLIDEAQELSADALDQIRVLTDLVAGDRHLVQTLLVGQPELDVLLQASDARALQQRIARRHRLWPLSGEEVRRYVARRLFVARRPSDEALALDAHPDDPEDLQRPFTPAALRAVARLSRGIPRVINVLCDRALESAHAAGSATVGVAAVLGGAHAMQLRLPFGLWLTAHRRPFAVAATAVLAAVIAAGVVRGGRTSFLSRPRPTEATTVSVPARPASDLTSTPPPSPAAAVPRAADLLRAEAVTIVISSFRTEARAAQLAADVAHLDVPAFTRSTSSGWQQVIAGPYISRDEAVLARERLGRAGFGDSQIVTPSDSTSATTAATPLVGTEATGPRVVLLTPSSTRSSVLVENAADAPSVRSLRATDEQFVFEFGPVPAHWVSMTFTASGIAGLVDQVILSDAPRADGITFGQVTVTTRLPATGAFRVDGRRVYFDFGPKDAAVAPPGDRPPTDLSDAAR